MVFKSAAYVSPSFVEGEVFHMVNFRLKGVLAVTYWSGLIPISVWGVLAVSSNGPASLHRLLVRELQHQRVQAAGRRHGRKRAGSRAVSLRVLQAFNHTQFTGLDTTARFDASVSQINSDLGAFTAASSPRIIQLGVKIYF